MRKKTVRLVGAGFRTISSACRFFLAPLLAVAFVLVAPLGSAQEWGHHYSERPADSSDCPEGSVFVPGGSCIAEGEPRCGITGTTGEFCRADVNYREDPPGFDEAFGPEPVLGLCPDIASVFWVGSPSTTNPRGGLSYEDVTLGGVQCNSSGRRRLNDDDGDVQGCCFSCTQSRQLNGFCQVVPDASTPDCARPGWAYSNPGMCEPDPTRPECASVNCTENFSGDPCCVTGDGDNEAPEVPEERDVKKPKPPKIDPRDDGRPDKGSPAGPGNRPAGDGVTGDAGTLSGGDSDPTASPGGNSMGHRNAGVSGLAKGVSRLDACTLAKRFLDPCDTISAVCVNQASLGANAPCTCERGDSPEALRAAALGSGRQCVAASNGVLWCYEPGHSNCAGRVYYDTSCETYTPNFNDDCDGTCDECDEFALQDLRFVQCPGNEPPSDNTQTSVRLGKTWYCNAVLSGARWCATPSSFGGRGPYDYNIENPCSETTRRVPEPPAPPDDQGPGDPNGYCTPEKIAANDPACTDVTTLGGDVPPGSGVISGGFGGFDLTFSAIGVTLSGLFSIPANDRTTVLITIPPGLTRTITIGAAEFVIFDKSVMTEVVSLAFCTDDEDCTGAMDFNPISETLITSFVSGDGLSETRAEFVFGDPETERFTGFDRPNCTEPLYSFGSVVGRDVDTFIDAHFFRICDVLEGEQYGLGVSLADFILAINIFSWLLGGTYILLRG